MKKYTVRLYSKMSPYQKEFGVRDFLRTGKYIIKNQKEIMKRADPLKYTGDALNNVKSTDKTVRVLGNNLVALKQRGKNLFHGKLKLKYGDKRGLVNDAKQLRSDITKNSHLLGEGLITTKNIRDNALKDYFGDIANQSVNTTRNRITRPISNTIRFSGKSALRIADFMKNNKKGRKHLNNLSKHLSLMKERVTNREVPLSRAAKEGVIRRKNKISRGIVKGTEAYGNVSKMAADSMDATLKEIGKVKHGASFGDIYLMQRSPKELAGIVEYKVDNAVKTAKLAKDIVSTGAEIGKYKAINKYRSVKDKVGSIFRKGKKEVTNA